MPLGPPPRERFLGGFYVGEDEPHDAIHRGRRARYIIVLDSYADAVMWRRIMAEEDNFITPLSQAAGAAAGQLRSAIALVEAQAEEAADAEPASDEPEGEAPENTVAPEDHPLDAAADHLRALLTRSPSYTDYDELFVVVERCAYCEAELSDGGHAEDCAWQAARRFLLEQALGA